MRENAIVSPHSARTQNPFAPQNCPDCGYALTGLPPAGRCPECGIPYDDTMIVIYGFGAGARQRGYNRRDERPSWMRITLFCAVGVVVAFMWLSTGGGRGLGLVMTVFLAASMWDWWRRRAIASPLPVQLRMTPEGFAQRDGFGAVTLVPWSKPGLYVRLRRMRKDSFALVAEGRLLNLLVGKTWVGVEFPASSDTARFVSDQIENWIQRAGAVARYSFDPDLPWWQRHLW